MKTFAAAVIAAVASARALPQDLQNLITITRGTVNVDYAYIPSCTTNCGPRYLNNLKSVNQLKKLAPKDDDVYQKGARQHFQESMQLARDSVADALGIQTVDDEVYQKGARQHFQESMQLARDSVADALGIQTVDDEVYQKGARQHF